MVRSRVLCRGIFPLICVVAAGCSACSSDTGSPNIGNAGQAPVAGSSASAGSAGSAPLGGSAAQGGSTATLAGTGGVSGSATAGTTSEAGSAAGGSAGAGGGAAQGGSGGGSAGSGGSGGSAENLPPLEPCAQPSVSHLKVWEMQVVSGSQVPPNGSPLRKYDGGGYEMHVEWTLNDGSGYGTANTPLNNMGQYANGADPLKNIVDISKADGITLEYASTGSSYLQLRTAAVPHGGDHFKADLPPTNGQMQVIKLAYDKFRRPGGTTPPTSDVLSGMFSLTFVGSTSTQLTLRQIRIAGVVPPCN